MLVEVGALISWCIYSYRIVMLLVPYMWASMTFLPVFSSNPLNAAQLAIYSNLLVAFHTHGDKNHRASDSNRQLTTSPLHVHTT